MINNLRLLAIMSVIIFLSVICSEVAELTGYTDLPYARKNNGDNYAVFRGGQYLLIPTSLAPIRIIKRDGHIIRAESVLLKTLPVVTYSPASAEEQVLYNKHFL